MNGCLSEALLQAWLDSELSPETSAAARSHLAACDACAANVRAAEQALSLVRDGWRADLPEAAPTARLRARLQERLVVTAPPVSTGVLGGHGSILRWSIAAAIAVMVIAATVLVRMGTLEPEPGSLRVAMPINQPPASTQTANTPVPVNQVAGGSGPLIRSSAALSPQPSRVDGAVPKPVRRATWIESETSRHLQQTQQLLRSIRNAGAEPAFDLAYELKFSRELLNRNRLLRRRAEQQEDRGTEQVLVRVEPILLDIANLPDRPVADEVNSVRDMIRNQSLIAQLQRYAARVGS